MLHEALTNIANELYGATATESEVEFLRSRLPETLLPEWLVDLLKTYKLGSVSFSQNTRHDDSGIGAEVTWLKPYQIVSEARDVEPGISLVDKGFLPIGSCAMGSGDPYFLDLRRATNDPPLVRIPHDCAGDNLYPLDRIEVVARSLSEFFSTAVIR
jgi:hypothetical protein